jgi:hypothetical protein
MNTNTRELIGSPIRQSVREKRIYKVQLPASTNATSPAVKVWDVTTGADVSAESGVLTGSANIQSGVFVTPLIQVPQPLRLYRVECCFSIGDEQVIRYFVVNTEP